MFYTEENYEFSLPLEDDENDVTDISNFKFYRGFRREFCFEYPTSEKEIAFKEPDQENYMILIQTDIIGQMRYYPECSYSRNRYRR